MKNMNCNSSDCSSDSHAARAGFAFSSPVGAVLNDPRLSPFFSTTLAQARDRSTLPLDISETADQIVVRASLPGFARENVNIQVEDGVLTITATRPPVADSAEQYHRRERLVGTVSRVVRLSPEVDDAAIKAELKDGELTLRLPKVPQAQPRKIDIG